MLNEAAGSRRRLERYLSAFSEPFGQGWAQGLALVVAFLPALLIGIEREAQHKSARIGTYTPVGLGSAQFVLISTYGFTAVLGNHIILDPSRVAAQVVGGPARGHRDGSVELRVSWVGAGCCASAPR